MGREVYYGPFFCIFFFVKNQHFFWRHFRSDVAAQVWILFYEWRILIPDVPNCFVILSSYFDIFHFGCLHYYCRTDLDVCVLRNLWLFQFWEYLTICMSHRKLKIVNCHLSILFLKNLAFSKQFLNCFLSERFVAVCFKNECLCFEIIKILNKKVFQRILMKFPRS